MRIKNTLHSCTLLSPSAQENNPTSPQQHCFLHHLLCTLHVKLHPSSSLLGMMPSPSHWHVEHFTPFILSTAPFELTNCRDRLFVESEVWALCHRDYSESLLVISSWEYNLNCATWLLHDRAVCCTAFNSHLHYNITLHRWLEIISVSVWVIWFGLGWLILRVSSLDRHLNSAGPSREGWEGEVKDEFFITCLPALKHKSPPRIAKMYCMVPFP